MVGNRKARPTRESCRQAGTTRVMIRACRLIITAEPQPIAQTDSTVTEEPKAAELLPHNQHLVVAHIFIFISCGTCHEQSSEPRSDAVIRKIASDGAGRGLCSSGGSELELSVI